MIHVNSCLFGQSSFCKRPSSVRVCGTFSSRHPAMRTRALCYNAFSSLLFLFILYGQCESSKLLVMPPNGSPGFAMSNLVEMLSQRGHQIVLVVPEGNTYIKKMDNVTVITFTIPYKKEFLESMVKDLGHAFLDHKPLPQYVKFMYEQTMNFTEFIITQCRSFLHNETLIKYLEDYKFDAMFSDPAYPCAEILAEHLSIPSIAFMRALFFGADLEATQSPAPPSYVPRISSKYTDRMNFSQRVKNVLLSFTDFILSRQFYAPFAALASEFLHKEVTVMDLFSRVSLWLVRSDFIFEFPRPVMPNMIFVGGMNCARRNPLSQEFEKLVNSSGEHGFVVFSLGSMVSEIPMHKAMDIAEAFGGIPQTVIWRYTGKAPSNLYENTHLVKWLPQNDLLAHPKARAFITHAGSHGVYEGICNAVPMVMLPLFGDQMDNAKRVESRGAGITLNVLDFVPQDLTDALTTVINNPSYKENIQRLSALHLDRPIHPLDLAVHWVEFVMRHKGAPHLRPAAHDLNWIQYHSIDVFAFLLAVVLTTLFIGWKCCACAFRCCCGRKATRPKTKSKSLKKE